MTTVARKMTAEEFEAYAARHEGPCELVRGEVRNLSPTGGTHGRLEAILTAAMVGHVRAHDLGEVVAGDVGFQLDDDGEPTVRAPDIAFISKARGVPLTEKFYRAHPDLVVEILSPDDRASEVTEKVRWWLAHGVRLVWVVDAATRSVAVHEPDGRSRLLGEGDALRGGDVLPGFELPLAELFA